MIFQFINSYNDEHHVNLLKLFTSSYVTFFYPLLKDLLVLQDYSAILYLIISTLYNIILYGKLFMEFRINII